MQNHKMVSPGDTITIRLPVDTPQEVINYLNDLKSRDTPQPKNISFSAECSTLFVRAVQESLDARLVKIISPEPLTLKQEEWLSHPYTRLFMGKFLFQFINEPDKHKFLENK